MIRSVPHKTREPESAKLLRKKKYRDVGTEMVVHTIQDRIDDYYDWCAKYECPNKNFDSERYEYFNGYGLALEFALDIVSAVHQEFLEKPPSVSPAKREESIRSQVTEVLRNPKHSGITTGMVVRAIKERAEDYQARCKAYECPGEDFDGDKYQYFKGYGRALELAHDIVSIVLKELGGKTELAKR